MAAVRYRFIGLDERGRPVGEDHPNAILTDAQCEEVRRLAEGRVSYTQLAAMFGVSRYTIGRIVRFQRRATAPRRWKRVPISE